MLPKIPAPWRKLLKGETDKQYFRDLQDFLEQEYATRTVYPPAKDVFAALKYTPYEQVSVLLLGQDPYPGPNQAHGLSFSVRTLARTLPRRGTQLVSTLTGRTTPASTTIREDNHV